MSEETILETPFGKSVLKFSKRRTLEISVLPEGVIELVAPHGTEKEEILKRLQRRRKWINRQKRHFSQLNAIKPPLKYCSGATHRYLGKQYRLKVRKSRENSVKLSGAFFQVLTQDQSEKAVKVLMDGWMRTRAHQQFSQRLETWMSWCKRRGLPTPILQIRSMARRWGSSHRNGKIFLNPDLVRTPSICVDYVIAHEICHLKYPYHDRHFYRLLGELYPDWKVVKLRLEQAEF